MKEAIAISKKMLVLLLLLLLLPLCALAETLTVGMSGDAVKEIKARLQALGYYRNVNLTRQYTEDTAERVRRFQQVNGLPETGEVDAATMAALFADDALRAPWPTMQPLATPAPTPVPDWPERDADGYLAGEGEYYYENPREGLWIYLSADLRVEIVRREDSRIGLRWFETEIWTRNGAGLRSVASASGRAENPADIARDAGLVLGFSDDFYTYRINNKEETVGIILRDGQILYDRTRNMGHHLPNLDLLAQYPDGTLAVYAWNEITAEELQAAGAVNVYCFGPILIRDGEINEVVYENYKSLEPRHALGMIEPGHYFVLSIQGRTAASEGTTLQRAAEMLKAHGVTQALNLDGGNTMALVFHGKILNEPAVYEGKRFVRSVPSLIGVGNIE